MHYDVVPVDATGVVEDPDGPQATINNLLGTCYVVRAMSLTWRLAMNTGRHFQGSIFEYNGLAPYRPSFLYTGCPASIDRCRESDSKRLKFSPSIIGRRADEFADRFRVKDARSNVRLIRRP